MYFECFLKVSLIMFLPLYHNVHASLKVNEGKINDAIIFFSSFIRIYNKNLGKENLKKILELNSKRI